jgi:hypothetical protein
LAGGIDKADVALDGVHAHALDFDAIIGRRPLA